MDHRRHTGASAYRWKDAWDTYDDPDLGGVTRYVLPKPDSFDEDERFRYRLIHEGDRFWDTEERYTITVTDVRTKIYQGVIAEKGTEGNDCVFYETDWNPPRRPLSFRKPHHPHRDDEPFRIGVEEFAEAIADGTLVPHRGNGIDPPP